MELQNCRMLKMEVCKKDENMADNTINIGSNLFFSDLQI